MYALATITLNHNHFPHLLKLQHFRIFPLKKGYKLGTSPEITFHTEHKSLVSVISFHFGRIKNVLSHEKKILFYNLSCLKYTILPHKYTLALDVCYTYRLCYFLYRLTFFGQIFRVHRFLYSIWFQVLFLQNNSLLQITAYILF